MSRSPETITLPVAVDPHVHDREPSPLNKSETFASGSRARLFDGYGVSFDMTNTPDRETWTYERAVEKRDRILETAYAPMGIWFGSQPDHDNIGEFQAAASLVVGKKGYTHPTTANDKEWQADDFREIEYEFHKAAPDKPHAFHFGPDNLEGFIDLAEELGFWLHACHMNSPRDVEAISRAKRERNVKITTGVCVKHLVLTDLDVLTRGSFVEVQPPLVHQFDAEELRHQLLVSNQIDMIETDHTPHSYSDKMAAETGEQKVYGAPDEFAQRLLLRWLKMGLVTPERFKEIFVTNPANLTGIEISDQTQVTWDLEDFRIEREDRLVESGAAWTPYLGMLACGKIVKMTIGGKTVIANNIVKDRAPQFICERGAVI